MPVVGVVGGDGVAAGVDAGVGGRRGPGPAFCLVNVLGVDGQGFEPDEGGQDPLAGFDQGTAVSAGKDAAVAHAGGDATAQALDQPGYARWVRWGGEEGDAIGQQGPAMEGGLVFARIALQPLKDAIEFGHRRGIGGVGQRVGEFCLDKLGHLGCVKAGQSGHGASRSAWDGRKFYSVQPPT